MSVASLADEISAGVEEGADPSPLPPSPKGSSKRLGESQIPQELVVNVSEYSSLSVWAWAEYEHLGYGAGCSDGKDGLAFARRDHLMDMVGLGKTAIDDARRALIEDDYLERRIQGSGLGALHRALKRPRETGCRFSAPPTWTLSRVSHKPQQGKVRPDAWRIYCRVLLEKGRNPVLNNVNIDDVAEWIGSSRDTAKRRLKELETAGLVEVISSAKGVSIRPCLTPERAAQNADFFAEHGRRSAPRKVASASAPGGSDGSPGGSQPVHLAAVTQCTGRQYPSAPGGTPNRSTSVPRASVNRASVQRESEGCVSTSPSPARDGSQDTHDSAALLLDDKRLVYLTSNFTITGEMLAEARRSRPDLDDKTIKSRSEEFKGKYLGQKSADWTGRWLSWIDSTLTPLSESFWYDDSMELWATEKAPKAWLDIDTQTRLFVAEKRSQGRLMANWVEAWKSWMLKCQLYFEANPDKAPTGQAVSMICPAHPNAGVRSTEDGPLCASCWSNQFSRDLADPAEESAEGMAAWWDVDEGRDLSAEQFSTLAATLTMAYRIGYSDEEVAQALDLCDQDVPSWELLGNALERANV